MQSIAVRGVVAPLAVPLTAAEDVDTTALAGLVRYLDPWVDGYLVRGSSGEYPLLPDDAADEVLAVVGETAAPGRTILVGVGDTSTARAIRNVERLGAARFDAVAVTSGFYHPVNDQLALERHFRRVADASAKPVVLYNIPQNTGSNLAPATVRRLAEHPNVVGIKDSWGDVIQFVHLVLEDLPDGFAVMQGREELTAVSRYLGASGVVSSLADIAPWLLRAVLDAVDAGDRAAALDAQRDVLRTAALFGQGHWLAALKHAIAVLGFGGGTVIGPVPPLTDEQRAAVAALVEDAVAARPGRAEP